MGLGKSNITVHILDEVRHGEEERRKAGLRTRVKKVFGVVTSKETTSMVKDRRKSPGGTKAQRVIKVYNILHFIDFEVMFFVILFFFLFSSSPFSLCSLRYLI